MQQEGTLHIFLLKHLYDAVMQPVMKTHDLRRMELDVLLFLANNPQYDTASDVIHHRGLAKSHVSSSIAQLTKRRLLTTSYQDGDKKKIHLHLSDSSLPIINDGRAAQKMFMETLFKDFTQEEIDMMQSCFKRMNQNIKTYK